MTHRSRLADAEMFPTRRELKGRDSMAGKYRADFYDLLKKHELKVEDFKRPKAALPN